MKVYKAIKPLVREIDSLKRKGKTIGLIPTMGFLHEGHLSLIRKVVRDTDCVVVSVFVNPIQFGSREDFRQYPRDTKKDMDLCRASGADIVFLPAQKAMYPDGFSTYVNVEGLTNGLCGASRPGHFRGVTTVVAKLFHIVRPDISYFGQKDAQQAIVVKKMTEDLDLHVQIKVMPIVREKNGLAMSSRNTYLNPSERREAASLYRSLTLAKTLYKKGERSAKKIIREMRKIILKEKRAKIDYISIVDVKNLKDIDRISQGALAAVAVKFGRTRLIDNIILNQRRSM